MTAPSQAVVIGASAGALDALSVVLSALPDRFSMPVMVVVHIPSDKRSIIAELLKNKCALPLCEAGDKEPILAGHVYFAPPDYHLLVEPNGFLSLTTEEPVLFSRPSIDVLFESAADVYGAGLTGVVLTGANDDGARGLKVIVDNGGTGLVQNPAQAYASAMPEAALKRSPAAKLLTLQEIGLYLKNAGGVFHGK